MTMLQRRRIIRQSVAKCFVIPGIPPFSNMRKRKPLAKYILWVRGLMSRWESGTAVASIVASTDPVMGEDLRPWLSSRDSGHGVYRGTQLLSGDDDRHFQAAGTIIVPAAFVILPYLLNPPSSRLIQPCLGKQLWYGLVWITNCIHKP